MKIILNKLTLNGIKNINKPIELKYTNQTISSNFDIETSNIKAIYGPNGSGKSGIISAIYIYKKLISEPDILNDKMFLNFLKEIINKNSKKLSLEIVFTLINNNAKKKDLVVININ